MPRLSRPARRALTQERRAQILEAAEKVFTKRGYHGATVGEIAATARLAEGTLYLYFPSKRDLLLAVWEQIAYSSFLPTIDTGFAAADEQEAIAFLLRDRLQFVRNHGVFLRLVMHQADLDPVIRRTLKERFAHVQDVIRQRLRGRPGRAVPEGKMPILIQAVGAMIVGFCLMEHKEKLSIFHSHSVDTIARVLAQFVVHGMSGGLRAVPNKKGVAR
ncbi:MAG: TetR/AcrR family transcriptional regulator [Armatimonadetes bacterium]|nr:TetR/AcrR family transcriptional regulator [Armatimonadota bacterium]